MPAIASMRRNRMNGLVSRSAGSLGSRASLSFINKTFVVISDGNCLVVRPLVGSPDGKTGVVLQLCRTLKNGPLDIGRPITALPGLGGAGTFENAACGRYSAFVVPKLQERWPSVSRFSLVATSSPPFPNYRITECEVPSHRAIVAWVSPLHGTSIAAL
jgi:hypothetical protein